jgi:hypothetical protein
MYCLEIRSFLCFKIYSWIVDDVSGPLQFSMISDTSFLTLGVNFLKADR